MQHTLEISRDVGPVVLKHLLCLVLFLFVNSFKGAIKTDQLLATVRSTLQTHTYKRYHRMTHLTLTSI